jgi:hypothetical protein
VEASNRHFPRDVFFFGFGRCGISLPAAAARFFCFFVAIDPLTVAWLWQGW